MKPLAIERPLRNEYDPYYETYVGRIGEVPILGVLSGQSGALRDRLSSLAPEGGDFRYAPGKWTIKELLGHLNDAERVFAMRAACIGRGDSGEFPGMDQEAYVAAGAFAHRSVESLRIEFELQRASNVEMLGGLPAEAWRRIGTASGTRISVRALAWILAGHVDHHLAILDERYASAFTA